MKPQSLRHLLATLVLANALLASGVQADAQEASPNSRAFKVEYSLFEPVSRVPGSHHAGLFVGINEFEDVKHVRPLLYAVHDAVELAYLFVVELKLIPPDKCHLALSGKPEATSVVAHLRELEKLGVKVTNAKENTILKTITKAQAIATKKSDFLVASFSSHGFADPPVPYIMPSDGMREHLDSTALKLSKIEEVMGRSEAGHRLLLVDACQERVDASAARRTTGPVGLPMSDTWQTELKKPTGQAKLASCSKDQYSYESSELGGVGHGVFTYALLDALRGGAPADDKNLIRLDSVAKFVSRRVAAWTASENRFLPREKHKHQSPSFHGPETARQLPLAVRAGDVAMLTAALKARIEPNGPFTPDLHDRLVKVLPHLASSDASVRHLLSETHRFSLRETSTLVFVPYLKEELAKLEHSLWLSGPVRGWAVLAGIDNWKDPSIGSLKYCVSDTRRIKEVLVDPGGWPKDRFVVLSDQKSDRNRLATKIAILTALNNVVTRAKQDDTVFVFLTGHFMRQNGAIYFLPWDTVRSAIPETSIRVDTIYDMLGKCRAHRRLLVLDGLARLPARSISRGPYDIGPIDGAFVRQGLAYMASCSQGQQSYEADELGHGVFAYFLGKGLGGAADANGDGLVFFTELWRYTERNVSRYAMKEMNAKQQPVFSLNGRDFPICRARTKK